MATTKVRHETGHLRRGGQSLVVTIRKTQQQALGWEEGDLLSMQVHGDLLVICKYKPRALTLREEFPVPKKAAPPGAEKEGKP